MRYLVKARVKSGREGALLRAIEEGTLGRGSVAGDEYLRNMAQARLCGDGSVRWVEVCSKNSSQYGRSSSSGTSQKRVQDAHARHRCRDLNGTELWACSECDCTERLEAAMAGWGRPFLEVLREAVAEPEARPRGGRARA